MTTTGRAALFFGPGKPMEITELPCRIPSRGRSSSASPGRTSAAATERHVDDLPLEQVVVDYPLEQINEAFVARTLAR